MKKFAIAACLALLLIGGGFAYATPVAYLSVDINPSLEMGVNGIGHVVSLESLNQDGADVLANCDVKGMKVREAVHAIVDVAADLGYLKQGAVVSLTAITDDEEKGDKLTKEAKEGTDEALDENDTEAEVVTDNMSVARAEFAKENEISPGKMNLLQKLWEAKEGVAATTDDFEDILAMENDSLEGDDNTYAEGSVQNIMKAIKEIKKDAKLDANTDEDIDDTDSDTEDESIADKAKGNSANAPGQQLKNQTATGDEDVNDDDQDAIKPDKEKKPKKNAPDEEE